MSNSILDCREASMSVKRYLLVCLIEEAAEVLKAATKALRFGLDNHSPGASTTNEQDIVKELNDLMAVAELLEEYEVLRRLRNVPYMIEDIKAKKARVEAFMKYAL